MRQICDECEHCKSPKVPISRIDYMLFKEYETELSSIRERKGVYYERTKKTDMFLRFMREMNQNYIKEMWSLFTRALRLDQFEKGLSYEIKEEIKRDLIENASATARISNIKALLPSYSDKMLAIIEKLENASEEALLEILKILSRDITLTEKEIEEKYGVKTIETTLMGFEDEEGA